MPKLLKKGVKRSRLMCGDCRKLLKQFKPNTFSSVVTDPPYELGFMGKKWDSSGVAFQPETWRSVLRVCKPGAFLLAFGGTRTYHRLVCAIEDAGWEIRDCLAWIYGSGFPKSRDISKAIDKAAGAEREVVGKQDYSAPDIRGNSYDQSHVAGRERLSVDITAPATPLSQRWNGWGTALKPAHEPVVLAMKPLDGTFAANAERYGVAGLNIDGCRIETNEDRPLREHTNRDGKIYGSGLEGSRAIGTTREGRWPANLIHDGSDEVLEVFPETGASNTRPPTGKDDRGVPGFVMRRADTEERGHNDNGGSAARFFYCAKASKKERTCNGKVENKHPTVKPLSLMKYLVKLVSYPKLNYILDPFCGSGSTLVACKGLGIRYVGIDLDNEAVLTAIRRLKYMGVG